MIFLAGFVIKVVVIASQYRAIHSVIPCVYKILGHGLRWCLKGVCSLIYIKRELYVVVYFAFFKCLVHTLSYVGEEMKGYICSVALFAAVLTPAGRTPSVKACKLKYIFIFPVIFNFIYYDVCQNIKKLLIGNTELNIYGIVCSDFTVTLAVPILVSIY